MAFDNYTAPVTPVIATVRKPTLRGTTTGGSTTATSSGIAGSSGTSKPPLATLGAGPAGGGNTTTSTGTSTTQTNSTVQNMDDESLAALNTLIAQLQGGGTPEMLADRAARLKAIASAQAQQAAYSKDAAMRDAQGTMDQQTRKVMEQLLPSLTRSAEGAGTSQNALRALLMQKGANEAAESASALGLKAATDYGQVQNGVSSILAQLVSMKDPAADALLAALGIAKGAVQNTNGTSTTTQSSTGTATNPSVGIASGNFNSGPVFGTAAPMRANSITNFNPNDTMSAYGNFNPSVGISGLSGLSYGTSGQTMGQYLGGSFADQFTFGEDNGF